MYLDLYGQKQLKKTYRERVMELTLVQFLKWTSMLPDTILDERGVDQTSWIFSVTF